MKLFLLILCMFTQFALAQECKLDLNSPGKLQFTLFQIDPGQSLAGKDPVYLVVKVRTFSATKKPYGTNGAVAVVKKYLSTTVLGKSEVTSLTADSILRADVPVSLLNETLSGSNSAEIQLQLRSESRLSAFGLEGHLLQDETIDVSALGAEVEGSPCYQPMGHILINGNTMLLVHRSIKAVP